MAAPCHGHSTQVCASLTRALDKGAHLEADSSPAVLEDGVGVPEGRVDSVEGGAVGGLVEGTQAVRQHPEVVAMHVERVLLLCCSVGPHTRPVVTPWSPRHMMYSYSSPNRVFAVGCTRL